MRNQSYEKQFKALAARLRFLQKRLWDMPSGNEREQIADAMHILADKIEKYYGEKIAREMFWKVKEK